MPKPLRRLLPLALQAQLPAPRLEIAAGGMLLWLVISLPIPPTVITPNAQRGQSKWASIKKSRVVKRHRVLAKLETLRALSQYPQLSGKTLHGYSLNHFFPSAGKTRDDDNADGSCKAYRDGICDALKRDDKHIKKLYLSNFEIDATTPRVEVMLFFI